MTRLLFPLFLLPACFGLVFALGLALTSPVSAIQNIGFPDDQRFVVNDGDLAQFQSAQKALHDALISMIKFDGVEGYSKQRNAALKSIGTNAQIIEGIAKRAGNTDIGGFMASVKSWSASGDAEDRSAKLLNKIADSLLNLKVKTK